MDTLNAFWQSADSCVMDKHFRSKRRTPSPGKYVVNQQWVVRTARAAWGWMQKEDGLRMTYAGVLKLFQLRQTPGDLELGKPYGVIMLDEAQDVNDCTAAIVLGQTKCGIIIVGDPHQVGERNCRVTSVCFVCFPLMPLGVAAVRAFGLLARCPCARTVDMRPPLPPQPTPPAYALTNRQVLALPQR